MEATETTQAKMMLLKSGRHGEVIKECIDQVFVALILCCYCVCTSVSLLIL